MTIDREAVKEIQQLAQQKGFYQLVNDLTALVDLEDRLELEKSPEWKLGRAAVVALLEYRDEKELPPFFIGTEATTAVGKAIVAAAPQLKQSEKVWLHYNDIPKDVAVIDNDGDRNEFRDGVWQWQSRSTRNWNIVTSYPDMLDQYSEDNGPFVRASG